MLLYLEQSYSAKRESTTRMRHLASILRMTCEITFMLNNDHTNIWHLYDHMRPINVEKLWRCAGFSIRTILIRDASVTTDIQSSQTIPTTHVPKGYRIKKYVDSSKECNTPFLQFLNHSSTITQWHPKCRFNKPSSYKISSQVPSAEYLMVYK